MVLKELLDIAKSHLEDITSIPDPDFRLEQAEFKKEEGVWDIVVSYLVENTNKRNVSIPALAAFVPYQRMYKQLKIDNSTKEVIGLYIFNN